MQNDFSLFNKVPTGIVVINSDYKVLFWNKTLSNWTKISEQEITGKNIKDFFEKFKNKKITSRLDSVFVYGNPVIFSSQLHKYIIPCKLSGGNLRYQQCVVTSIKSNVEKDQYYAIISIQDVTDVTRKIEQYKDVLKIEKGKNIELERVQVKVLASECNLRNMIELFQNAIVIIHDNKFIFNNNSFCKILDCDSEELKNTTFDNIQNRDSKIWYNSMLEMLQTSEFINIELQFDKKNREIIHINALFKKTEFEDRHSIIAIFRDITEKNEILEMLQENIKQSAESGTILTICSSCHKIKDTHDDPPKYIKLESYLTKYVSHSDISHGICESCFEELYPNFYENIK